MEELKKPSLLDVFLIAIAVIIWASAFQAIKIAVQDVPPMMLATIRVGIGFLFLLPVGIYIGLVKPTRRSLYLLIIAATFNAVLPFSLISWAELKVTSAEASLMMGAGPFFALIIAHFFTDDEKLNWHKFIGCLVGAAGILILFGRDVYQSGGGDIKALMALLLASLCYVISSHFIRKVKGINALLITIYLFGLATLILSLSLMITGQLYIPKDVSQNSILALFYLGIFPTGIAFLMRNYLIRKIGFSYFAMGVNLLAPTGVLLGALILSEPVSIEMGLSIVFILIGLYIARRGA